MIRRAFLPLIEQFEADSPYANGNWGHIVNRCRMAAAIFLDDKDLYRYSLDIYLHANDNGSLPHYISETGQCQETGRDQAHAQLGLGTMCDICEMAWQQGDDLWGALDNRLMKGMEYSARYNLGYDVPFETWQDCTGLYCDWTEPGSMQRGRQTLYDGERSEDAIYEETPRAATEGGTARRNIRRHGSSNIQHKRCKGRYTTSSDLYLPCSKGCSTETRLRGICPSTK